MQRGGDPQERRAGRATIVQDRTLRRLPPARSAVPCSVWGGRGRRWAVLALAGAWLLPAAAGAQLERLTPLDATGRITYNIAEPETGSRYQPGDRQLALWALADWARHGNGALRFEEAPASTALIRIHWVPASAGQYGEVQPLDVNGRRGAAVYVRPDTDALGPDIRKLAREDPLLRDTVVYLTCLHELGHALGLEHTAEYRDIMYFFGYGGDIPGFFLRYRRQLSSRDDIAGVSGLSEGDIATLRALYRR